MNIFPSPRQWSEFDGSLGYKISCEDCPWIWNFGKTSSSFASIPRSPSLINLSSMYFFIWRHRNCDSVWNASSSVRLVYFLENCFLSTGNSSSYSQNVSQDILSLRYTSSLLIVLLMLLPVLFLKVVISIWVVRWYIGNVCVLIYIIYGLWCFNFVYLDIR